MIVVEDLRKSFWVARRRPGLWAQLAGLARRDGRLVTAVDGITFRVAAGEMVGYIGPNGAGKSTTIKMLTGILMPSAGVVTVAGLTPSRHRRRLAARIGAVFGQRSQLWWDLPLVESLELLRHVYRVPADRFRENLARFRGVLGLDEFLSTPVRQLSLGQRMRGDLAAALLHDPEVLYLDEPTIGLDVVAKEHVRAFLAHVNRERGVTVLLTTHDMVDIARLCQRTMIIDHGRLLYDGPLEAIRERFGQERTLVVDLDDDEAVDVAIDVPLAHLVRAEGRRRWLRFRRDEVTASALIAAVSAGYRLRDLTIEEPEIEAIIRRIYDEGI